LGFHIPNALTTHILKHPCSCIVGVSVDVAVGAGESATCLVTPLNTALEIKKKKKIPQVFPRQKTECATMYFEAILFIFYLLLFFVISLTNTVDSFFLSVLSSLSTQDCFHSHSLGQLFSALNYQFLKAATLPYVLCHLCPV
jgi:hypothetical protein